MLTPVNEAEHRLLTALSSGEEGGSGSCSFGDQLPAEAAPGESGHCTLRGAFLAQMLRSTTQHRVVLQGAAIHGPCNLESAELRLALVLHHCHFADTLELSFSHFKEFSASTTRFHTVNATELKTDKDLTFTACEFAAAPELTSATIGQDFTLTRCEFNTAELSAGLALNAPEISVARDFVLTSSRIHGLAQLYGARAQKNGVIGDNSFQAPAGKTALDASGFCCEHLYIYKNKTNPSARIDLTSAQVGILNDELPEEPEAQTAFDLVGLTYREISPDSHASVPARIAWLRRGSLRKGAFHLQPWTQFARMLRETGHDADARKVLIAREDHYIRHEQARILADYHKARARQPAALRRGPRAFAHAVIAADRIWLDYQIRRAWGGLKSVAIGYGYAPQRALVLSVAIICLGAVLAQIGWQQQLFVPAQAAILASGEWQHSVQASPQAPLIPWLSSPSGQYYESFHALLWALDVYLPVMDLGQASGWSLSTSSAAGWWGRWLYLALQAAGWTVTSLGFAAVTGLVQKNRE